MDADKMRQQLMDRLSENYGNYHAALLLYDRQELIDRASQIADTANAYQYLTQRSDTEQELACLLQFQNPLEVVADHLRADTPDFHALDAVIADMSEKQAELSPYSLMKDAPAPKPETMRKFMNVDIESTLKQLRGQMTIYYQDDLNYALDKMRKGARSDRPEKKNFVVFFRKSGVECMNERELFIRGSESFNTCQHFHTMNREPVLAYGVEITSGAQGKLRGNLYQVDNHQLAAFAARVASPFTNMTVMFLEGHEALLSKEEATSRTWQDVEYEYGGRIVDTRREPEDESVVQSAIRQEHKRREQLPKGYFAAHVKSLETTRIQAEADRIAEAFQELKEPNSPDKATFTVPISDHFIALADQRQIHSLFEKLREQMPDKPIFVDRRQGDEKKFSIGYHADRVKVAEQKEEQAPQQGGKPSIRGQLAAAKAAQENRPAGQQHQKDKGAR